MIAGAFASVSAAAFMLGCGWAGFYLVNANDGDMPGMARAGRAAAVAFAVSALCWLAAKA